MTGLADIREEARSLESDWFAGAIEGIWIAIGAHWFIVASLAVLATTTTSKLTPLVLDLCMMLLVIDVLLLLVFVGPFIGELLLAFSAIGYAFGVFWSRE